MRGWKYSTMRIKEVPHRAAPQFLLAIINAHAPPLSDTCIGHELAVVAAALGLEEEMIFSSERRSASGHLENAREAILERVHAICLVSDQTDSREVLTLWAIDGDFEPP